MADCALAEKVEFFIYSSLDDIEKASRGKYKVCPSLHVGPSLPPEHHCFVAQVLHFTLKAHVEQYVRSLALKAGFVRPGYVVPLCTCLLSRQMIAFQCLSISLSSGPTRKTGRRARTFRPFSIKKPANSSSSASCAVSTLVTLSPPLASVCAFVLSARMLSAAFQRTWASPWLTSRSLASSSRSSSLPLR